MKLISFFIWNKINFLFTISYLVKILINLQFMNTKISLKQIMWIQPTKYKNQIKWTQHTNQKLNYKN